MPTPLDPKRFAAKKFEDTLNAGDPRWLQLTKRIDSGDYEGAARVAEGVFEDGICDAGLLGYYLYGCFDSQRIEELAEILETLTNAMLRSKPASEASPSHPSRDAAHWLLCHITRRLERTSPRAWISRQALDVALAKQLERSIDGLRSQIRTQWPGSPAASSVERLARWWRDTSEVLTSPPLQAKCDEEAASETLHEVGAAMPTFNSASRPTAWLDLQTRLETFERLSVQGDWLRAAILAEDIERRLSDFDPRHYFPELLAPYYSARSRNGSAIEAAPLDCLQGTRLALEELCAIDIGAFGASGEGEEEQDGTES